MPLFEDDKRRVLPPNALDPIKLARAKGELPALERVLKDGQKAYRPFEPALEDIHHAFLNPLDTPREKEDMEPGFEGNHPMIDALLNDPNFASARETCRGDETLAAVGTKAYAESFLKQVEARPQEERDKVNERSQAQQLAEQFKKALEAQMESDPNGTAPETQALKEKLQAAQEKLQSIEDSVQPEFWDNVEAANRSMARKAAEAMNSEVNKANAMLTTWGTHAANFEEADMGEKLQVIQLLSGGIMGAVDMVELMKMVGRFEGVLGEAKPNIAADIFKPETITLGRDPLHELPNETALRVICPELYDLRFIRRSQMVYAPKPHEEEGAFFLCVDFSDSMRWTPMRELGAKALVLALQKFARAAKRDVCIIPFNATLMGDFYWPKGLAPSRQLLKFLSLRPSGGTDFRKPLDKAASIMAECKELRDADVVLITDGEMDPGNAWIERFHQTKKSMGFRVHSFLVDCKAEYVDRFSDRVVKATSLFTNDVMAELFKGLGKGA